MKNCKRCATPFEFLKAGRKLYCSDECKWRYTYENQPKKSRFRVCACCSVEFSDITVTNQLKHCSEDCHKHYPYKLKYGLSKQQFKELKAKHPSCGVCGRVNPKGAELSVDHCHRTGKVRGMLCQKCNQALGGFQDSKELLQSAIDYLRRSGEAN